MIVLNSLKPVLHNKKSYVSINENKIKNFTNKFNKNKIKHWLNVSPFNLNQLNEIEYVSFLFILNSISFSYWGNPKWEIQYKGQNYDGAQGMIACLGKAIEEEKLILNPQFISNIKKKELEDILKGNIKIPLFDYRFKFLKEIGNITEKEFNGDFRYIIDKANNNALNLVNVLTKYFPSFRDFGKYKKQIIYFNKRAQLLSADLHHLCEFEDYNKLTACADYKLPQVLRRYNILKYNPILEEKIKKKEIIPTGSKEEIEIRAYTIHAVELIKNRIPGITSNQVNDYLWLEGQTKLLTDESYHLTRTKMY